jgi:hypothetical protein
MLTEADTCRKFVVPRLQTLGWDNEPHSIAEQRSITDGRIIPTGKGFVRKPPKRVDYLLRYTRDFPLAVIEAKPSYKSAADAVPQSKQYAEMLSLKFAYATNGHEIIEFDYFTGAERACPDYPSPAEHSSPRIESRRETLPGSEGRTYQCGARNSRLRASPLHHHGDGRGGAVEARVEQFSTGCSPCQDLDRPTRILPLRRPKAESKTGGHWQTPCRSLDLVSQRSNSKSCFPS